MLSQLPPLLVDEDGHAIRKAGTPTGPRRRRVRVRRPRRVPGGCEGVGEIPDPNGGEGPRLLSDV